MGVTILHKESEEVAKQEYLANLIMNRWSNSEL